MQSTETDLEPVREQTDRGLDQERARTDATIQRTMVDETILADSDIEKRRAYADERLRVRRKESDAVVCDRQAKTPSNVQSEVVDAERALEDSERQRERRLADSIVERERKRVDETVRLEREERRMVDKLLGLERAETDDRLRFEREKTDEIVDDASVLLVDEQTRLKKDVRRRDEFLALVSHELRNPLAAIAVSAQTLLETAPGVSGHETKETVEDIQIACAQMERLVGDLVDGVSIEAGRMSVRPISCDAHRLLQDAVAMSASQLRRRSLSLIVEAAGDPPFAMIDRPRVLQVFANLLANAAKFTAPGGKISVSVGEMGSMIRFSVTDTGRGIPIEDVSHVFERFWQRESRDRRGLGLGLYICKGIVEAHGGQIWVTSEPAVGSSFCFTVPTVV